MLNPENIDPILDKDSHLHQIQDPHLADLAREYLLNLLQGERQKPLQLILQAIEEQKILVSDIYLQIFQPALYEVGRLWETNQVSVAVEHFCTAATQLIMSQLFPYIMNPQKNGCSMVGCCVGKELHEVGMRMVCDFFEMQGWDTYFLGANCPSQDIVYSIRQRNADLLAISVTLSSHLPQARELIQSIWTAEQIPDLRILIGGHPFMEHPELAGEIGAHACGQDAAQAVQLAQKMVKCES